MIMKTFQTWLLTITIFLNIPSANAGGDYWSIKVQKKSIEAETTELTLLLLENPRGVAAGCKSIVVHVKHETVPIWAWLPFVSTSHPTRKETINAVKFLNKKYISLEDAYFGYVGGGLHKMDNEKCTFESKGLRLENVNNSKKHVVFSFYDPV